MLKRKHLDDVVYHLQVDLFCLCSDDQVKKPFTVLAVSLQ